MDTRPPFEETYNALFKNFHFESNGQKQISAVNDGECVLPVIDLNGLNSGESERNICIKEIFEAASQWGFFQIVNHGIPREVLEMIHHEEKQLFRLPFAEKARENFLNLSANSYSWGNPRAAYPEQFSWSEAFHISLADISKLSGRKSLGLAIEVYVQELQRLALRLCELLGKNLKVKQNFFRENCKPQNSYLRMNKYYPNPFSSEVYGLVPHTDSDFLTVIFQDQVGGLQLKKDGKWISVRPCSDALVVNIGDLFQALSNGIYKSIEHRVVPPQNVERLSIVYFFCPSLETEIQSFVKPEIYRKFSFREFKEQVKRDTKETGNKVGLSRFLL